MVKSGISREKAWDYIIENIATGATNNQFSRSDPYAPWSPSRSIGGSLGQGIGIGITQGIMVGSQLKKMRPDIERVIAANCPIGGSVRNYPSNQTKPSADDPWKKEYSSQEPLRKATTKGVIGIGVKCAYSAQKVKKLQPDELRNAKSDDCRVVRIVKNTPAYKDGRLRVGDKILEVNGQKVKQITQEELSKLIGGEPGTYATILVDGNSRPITIQRAEAAIFEK
ncbi:PDZ domain family protein [Synechococcus sp. A15-44]|nr:PDZ domain family protein [Synechococcus sp. A15-44]